MTEINHYLNKYDLKILKFYLNDSNQTSATILKSNFQLSS